MYMANKKPVTAAANKFSRWFRKRLRDPFLDFMSEKEPRLTEFLDALPGRLWSAITAIEGNAQMNGLAKMQYVQRNLATWLQSAGLQPLRPFITPYLEQAVFFIYRDHFKDKFKRWGLHEVMETWLDKDIDEDGDIGVPNTPADEPVEVPPTDEEKPEAPVEEPPAKKPTTKKAQAEKAKAQDG